MEEKHKNVLLLAMLILFGYWSFLLLRPFIGFLLLGVILAFLFYPLYRKFSKDFGDTGAAVLSVIIVVLLIIIPSFWLAANLVGQANNAYQMVVDRGMSASSIFGTLQDWTSFDITPYLEDAVQTGKDAVTAAIPGLISSTSNFIIGILLFFFVFYYSLKDGREWYLHASNALPIKRSYKRRLQSDLESMTRSLFYGQILTAALIGVGCGIIFFAFGVPNAVFWGFVMMVLAFLPLLGAPIVYAPAGIILMLQDKWVQGIGIIIMCTLIIFLIEYIIRPKFVSKTSQLHPLIVIIGALGGIYILGFVGFLVGPLILGIFVTLLGFDYGE